MRYLTRNKIYIKVAPQKDAKKIYIFCEGEVTEVEYFKYFQGFSSNIDIIPIPNQNGQSDPIKLKENAEMLFKGNEFSSPKFILSPEYKDEIWFVIDTDRWYVDGKIENLKGFCKSNNDKQEVWNISQSNPSFEVWFYYHYFDHKPNEYEVKKFNNFKDYLNSKIIGGFDKRKMPIELELAIHNSSANFTNNKDQPSLYSTDVHNLGKIILPFVKIQLDKVRK